MKFQVKIREILEQIVEVDAETHPQAERIVEEQYYYGKHVLDSSDFVGVTFNTVREHEVKTVYIIGHKGYNSNDDLQIYFLQGLRDGAYDTTYDVTKAQRFDSKDELFDFLRNYCYFDKSILFEFTEEYLERIKDNEDIKARRCDVRLY